MNIRENVADTNDGFVVNLFGGGKRIGYVAVSVMMLESLTANIDYVFVRHEENRRRGYGRLLMAHWLVEASKRDCEFATADFIDFRALRAFKRTVGGALPTRMVCTEAIEGYKGYAPQSYEHAEQLLNTETQDGQMLCGGISCDLSLANPTFVESAKRVIAAQRSGLPQ